MPGPAAPILREKATEAPSVFRPESLLREARRQRSIAESTIPRVCLLDPDGDLLRYLRAEKGATRSAAWACYHTELHEFVHEGVRYGIVGNAVGAPFAVLLAEQMFVSGCELLLSMTSSGRLAPAGDPPYFVLIDAALRDEGTSYHYLPPSDMVHASPVLVDHAASALARAGENVLRGATWTTDAPFRETEAAIRTHSERGLLAVEMEAAALYAFAEARQKPVLCFAHVTNQMAQTEGDFEKGAHGGAIDALRVLSTAARACGATSGVPGPADD